MSKTAIDKLSRGIESSLTKSFIELLSELWMVVDLNIYTQLSKI